MNITKANYARGLEESAELSQYVNKLLTYELMPLNEN
jgi:mannosyltransferase OCH1-like enzyme